MHVEEDQVRRQGAHLRERRRSVGRLADDLEALGLEQQPGARAEARVVVDDEDGMPNGSAQRTAATVARRRATESRPDAAGSHTATVR